MIRTFTALRAGFMMLLGATQVGCADEGSNGDGGNGGDGATNEDGGGDAVGGSGNADGGGGDDSVDPCAGFATEVVSVEYGADAGFGQEAMPGIVLGAPHGGGELQGSLDVVALGNGGSITLAFGQQLIEDQDGPDFIVFENAFFAGGDPEATFAELGTVSVSSDGETWLTFECSATEAPYGACAGWHPVPTDGDPHDPRTAGGDAFDLAEVGLSEARFVRIVDRADTTGLAGSFDLDAVALVHWTCGGR